MLSKIADIESLCEIKDNSIVAISGFNMATTPEYLILELYKKYAEEGHPKNIFIISDALPAVPGRGLDQIAEKLHKDPNQGFLRGILMPFLGFSPWLQKLVADDRIECYGWPIGITSYWFREVGSGRPGLLTKIGVDTSIDPRREGAALNKSGKKSDLCKVSVLDIEGEEYLLYQAPKPNYAFIRSSTSDENGNLSLQDEGIRGTVLGIAQATKARPNQGIVIAQVRWVTKSGTINTWDVSIPGPLVDHVVVSPREYHWQSGTIEYDPRISYKVMPSITGNVLKTIPISSMKIHERVIARRVVIELIKLLENKQAPVLVNLGIGIPALVSSVAAEEEITEYIITVLESGPWGGLALSGNDFGLAISPFALSNIPDMFSNFEGGIIDAASLGFLQVDRKGNVNPSILPKMILGPGGFPVIAGGAPRIYFAGAFRGGKSEFSITNNELKILYEGPIPKFIENVYRIAFSAQQAVKHGHEILYITERGVFRLRNTDIFLEEVAPGVDIDKDIISKMCFIPKVKTIKKMDERIFFKTKMGIREDLMHI
jgi:acyl CoA:acetate/3-ketoacid CoA transferase